MDSSSKAESSTEISSVSSKTSDTTTEADSQTKSQSQTSSSLKFGTTGHSSSTLTGVATTGAGADTPATTTAETKTTSTTSGSTPFSATPPTTAPGSSPHSVTISLGVGALQVGKSQARIPSPPKASTTTAQDVTQVGTSVTTVQSSTNSTNTTTTTTTGAHSGSRDTPKTSTAGFTTISLTGGSTSSSESPSQAISEALKTSSAVHHTQGGVASTNSTSSGGLAPVVSESSSTSTLTTTSTMKRPPSEISGSPNPSTTEGGDAETGSDNKRRKIRKEGRNERSDSPATSNTSASHGVARNVRTSSGGKQVSPSSSSSGSGSVGEFSANKPSTIFGNKPAGEGSQPPEKAEESGRSTTTATTTGSSTSTTTTNPMTGGSVASQSVSATFGGGIGSNNGSGAIPLKVPPLKIVLQSHAQSSGTGTSTTTTGGSTSVSMTFKNTHSHSTEDSSQNVYGSPSGFPYVVSSTTTDSGNAGTTSSSQSSSDTAVSTSASNTSLKSASNPVAGGAAANEDREGGGDVKDSKTTGSNSTVSSEANQASSSGFAGASSTGASQLSSTSTNQPPATAPSSSSNNDSAASEEKLGKHKVENDHKKDPQANLSSTSSTTNAPLASSHSSSSNLEQDKESSSGKDKDVAHHKEKEKPVHRVTRSSQRILKEGGGTHTPNSPSSSSPKTSACPSPNHSNQAEPSTAEVGPSTSKQGSTETVERMDTSEPVDLHPRKRKLKAKDGAQAAAAAAHAHAHAHAHPPPAVSAPVNPVAENVEQMQPAAANAVANEQPMLNCFEMYLNIRKQIDRRRRNLFPVTPKPPKGFKDYLMNRGTYVLAGNANALAVPLFNAPTTISTQMKEFYAEQEKERHKLRLQHLVEKEKLVLSVEQEILRVHGRAARALSNQTLPFSVCTILKDQEVYNLLTPEQEEKDINARSRYNGRLFLSWLQDVDDKWDKIKEFMLLRHHNEAESLHAVQKMDWEWKLKEHGLCEPKATPSIDDIHVPMVHVSDDFDLVPG